MHNVSVRNGWERLPNAFDVEFRSSTPVRISDNGRGMTVPEDMLLEEVSALGKLHVSLDDWASGERAGEHESRLTVTGREFSEVLRRFAVSPAVQFVERYYKPVDDDVDWGRLEYLKVFRTALEICGLALGDFEMAGCFDDHVEVMHSETRHLKQSGELPLVEPEWCLSPETQQ